MFTRLHPASVCRTMRCSCFALVLLVLGAEAMHSQWQRYSFTYDGRVREYLVFLPQNFQPNMPVVFNLHGYTDNATWQMEYSQMNEVADTAGFVVVYPDAVSPGFNTGVFLPGWPPLPNVDDVGFVSALIDTLEAQFDIDMSRIYSCGYSNGGMMTFKVAGQLGHRFAAGASVASVMLDSIANHNHMIRPFPVLMCNGTEDALVSFGGGSPGMWSVQRTLDYWIQNNSCLVPGETVSLSDVDPTDGCTIETTTYRNGSGEQRVILYKVVGGGHTWPKGTYNWPTAGNTNRDVNMNVELWNFFKEFDNPLVNVAWGEVVDANPGYVSPQGDSLFITGAVRNIQGHPVTAYACFEGLDTSHKDSIQLFDDGQHRDGGAADNVWGGARRASDLPEDTYRTSLITYDGSLSTRHRLYKSTTFTTAGPIAVEGYTVISADTTAAPGKMLSYRINLRNHGTTATAHDVTANVRCIDSTVVVQNVEIFYGDLAPGQSSTGSTYQRVLYTTACTGSRAVEFSVEISSKGALFWKDTFTDLVTGTEEARGSLPRVFALEQNYPNPFNPTTVVRYQLPVVSDVKLVVYDILGKVVATLVDGVEEPGCKSVEWDASGVASGVYFYRLISGEFVQTRKLLFLR